MLFTDFIWDLQGCTVHGHATIIPVVSPPDTDAKILNHVET